MCKRKESNQKLTLLKEIANQIIDTPDEDIDLRTNFLSVEDFKIDHIDYLTILRNDLRAAKDDRSLNKVAQDISSELRSCRANLKAIKNKKPILAFGLI